jgi:hypothetical protein
MYVNQTSSKPGWLENPFRFSRIPRSYEKKIKEIARQEANEYIDQMTALERLKVSNIKVDTPLHLLPEKPWTITKFIGPGPYINQTRLHMQVSRALYKRNLRYRPFQETWNKDKRQAFKGKIERGYDIVYELLDHQPMEFRIHLHTLGGRSARVYLIAKNIKQDMGDLTQEILNDVKNRWPNRKIRICMDR